MPSVQMFQAKIESRIKKLTEESKATIDALNERIKWQIACNEKLKKAIDAKESVMKRVDDRD